MACFQLQHHSCNTSAYICLDFSCFISIVLAAWNRGIRWRHAVKSASPGRTQTLLVIRVSILTFASCVQISAIFTARNIVHFFYVALPSPFSPTFCSFLTKGKTWCGWWWTKSSRASRRSSTVSSLWGTRLTASTLSTCWWRWVTMCGQLRTLTRPHTSALLWETCWSLSRGTLTNALWVETIWREKFMLSLPWFLSSHP